MGKPERKRSLRRPKRRCEGNIKMDLQEVRCRCMDWIGAGSGCGQMAGTCEFGNERLGSVKCGEFLD